MSRYRTITDETIQGYLVLRASGKTWKQVAESSGKSYQAVRDALMRRGLFKPVYNSKNFRKETTIEVPKIRKPKTFHNPKFFRAGKDKFDATAFGIDDISLIESLINDEDNHYIIFKGIHYRKRFIKNILVALIKRKEGK